MKKVACMLVEDDTQSPKQGESDFFMLTAARHVDREVRTFAGNEILT